MLTLEQTTSLGPAFVLQAMGNRVELELPDDRVWAQCALAFPYHPVAGDIVLAVGQSGTWYVIGLIKGRGTTTISVPADLELRAPRGRISLVAASGVEVRSDEVRIATNRLEVSARTVLERFNEATRWVAETFQLKAGRLRARVAGSYDMRADRIVERADRDVKIDGQKIHLG